MKTLPSFTYPLLDSAEPRTARRRRWRSGTSLALMLALFCLSGVGEVHAETLTYSPVQAAARPLGLSVADRVQLAGSDAASAKFLTDTLPSMQHLIDANLRERAALKDSAASGGLIALKPEALTLAVSADVRAYFVGEGAGYHNTLGFNTGAGGVQGGSPLLIFPDASSPNSYMSSGGTKRTSSEPLMPGDFVSLGKFASGTHLDFFLISNGAQGSKTVFSTDNKLNPDRINHVVTFAQVKSPYVLVSFEDMYGGGDRDYNDAIFAVYFGERNVQTLLKSAALNGVPASEPGFIWLLVAACSGGLMYTRRRAARASRRTPLELSPRAL